MNKSTFFLAPLVLLAACNSNKVSNLTAAASFDQETEKSAIMKTIESETESFYKRDYDGWKKTFVQSDYAFQGWNKSDGSVDTKVGWAEVNAGTGDYIKNNPVTPGESAHPKVQRKNIVCKFYSDSLAYLTWDQYNSDLDMKSYHHSRETRIMEKHDDGWKIANVSAFWDYKNVIAADSIRF